MLARGARVLVTAGASGIGAVMASRFRAAGARTWIVDVADPPPGLETDARRYSRADVSDESALAEVFREVERAWGALDVVLANAGTAGPTAGIEDIELSDWRACLGVGLDGAFLTAKHAVPLLRRSSSGALIFTASTAGLHGYPNRAPYVAAKWGVVGLVKTLAIELGPAGVRVNAICPGAVWGPRMEDVIAREAELTVRTADEIRERYAASNSLHTWVEPEDVAALALLLASPAGGRISGQAIAVDGNLETTAFRD